MNKKMLPCPFCGGEAELYGVPHIPKGWDFIPRCKTTSCCGRQAKKYSSREVAIAAWNRRTEQESELPASSTPTNELRIRGMSDEELAAIIAADFTEEKLNYCQNKPECSAILETAGGIISDEWCIQCALDWLKAETEGTE